MRLSPEQTKAIRDRVRALLGAHARVSLFGSRVDDYACGGDIDLLVEVGEPLSNRAAMASRLAAELQIALGEQRIDVVLVDPLTPVQPIHEVAHKQGVLL
ncbi:MAG: nucleotidyltransferase domain-containing protein [Gammaproteobacteria bacterium]|nr:nucleotidyltransferase domain-containing protein [Gammaproteobacteria bacterium]